MIEAKMMSFEDCMKLPTNHALYTDEQKEMFVAHLMTFPIDELDHIAASDVLVLEHCKGNNNGIEDLINAHLTMVRRAIFILERFYKVRPETT